MKRIFSIFLTLVLISTIAVTHGFSVSGNSDVIYINTSGWENFSQVYCHIWVNKGNAFFQIEEDKEICSKVGTDLYMYDLSILKESEAIDGGLKEHTDYGVKFYTDKIHGVNTIYETYDITMDDECVGDTVVLTGNMLKDPYEETNLFYEAEWTINKQRCGSHITISVNGEFQGDYLHHHETGAEFLGIWISENYATIDCNPVKVLAEGIKKFKIYDIDTISDVVFDYIKDNDTFNSIYYQLEEAYNIAYNVEVLQKSGKFKYRILNNGTVEIAEYVSVDTSVTIPEKIAGKKVTSIGFYAFGECGYIKNIKIPNTIVSIKELAFDYCYGLTKITIPKSVKIIEYGAFKNCTALKSFVINKNNSNYCSVDGVLFSKNKKRLVAFPSAKSTKYVIPKGTTTICESAFYNCESLKKITMTDSVVSVEVDAFRDCKKLKNIVFSKNITNVGNNAFTQTAWYNAHPAGTICVGKVAYVFKTGSSALKNDTITIPKGIQTIAPGAYANIKGLKKVVFPETVKTIGYSSFFGNSTLEKVVLNEGLKTINTAAFEDCLKLKSIQIPYSVKTINKRAMGYIGFYNEEEMQDEYEILAGFLIKGYKNTVAEKYAEGNKIPFKKMVLKPILDITKKSLKTGRSFKNKVKILTDKKVEWKSSNVKIATVTNKGVVTALKKGNVKITAKIKDYDKMVCNVKVTTNPCLKKYGKKIKKLDFSKGAIATVDIAGKVSGINNVYKVQNPSIVKVISKTSSKTLKLSALKKGSTNIYVTVNGSYKIRLKVTVG